LLKQEPCYVCADNTQYSMFMLLRLY